MLMNRMIINKFEEVKMKNQKLTKVSFSIVLLAGMITSYALESTLSNKQEGEALTKSFPLAIPQSGSLVINKDDSPNNFNSCNAVLVAPNKVLAAVIFGLEENDLGWNASGNWEQSKSYYRFIHQYRYYVCPSGVYKLTDETGSKYREGKYRIGFAYENSKYVLEWHTFTLEKDVEGIKPCVITNNELKINMNLAVANLTQGGTVKVVSNHNTYGFYSGSTLSEKVVDLATVTPDAERPCVLSAPTLDTAADIGDPVIVNGAAGEAPKLMGFGLWRNGKDNESEIVSFTRFTE